MAFFEDLTKKTKDLAYVAADKAKDVAAVAADKAKDAAELTRISMAIAGEQREIDKNYRTIGEWFVSEYEGEIPDAVRDLVEAVNTSKAKIAELAIPKCALVCITGADQIIVMDAGRIIARGRHGDLLASCPLYARMWADHRNAAPDANEEA